MRRSPMKYELLVVVPATGPSSTKRHLLPNKKFNLLSPPIILDVGIEEGTTC